MTEIHDKGNDQAQELDDFDVEGHGLKEVALGLSAATIVAGGAGAASLALDNPLPGTTSGAQAAVAGVHGDVDDKLTWTQGVAAGPLATAGGAVGDVQQLAQETASLTVRTAEPVVTTATDTALDAAGTATSLAGDLVNDPIGTSDRVVDQALQTVRDTRDTALVTAATTVSTATTTADAAVDTAVGTVEATIPAATTLATSTAETAYETVDPSVSIDNSSEGGTSASIGAAGKTVQVDVS